MCTAIVEQSKLLLRSATYRPIQLAPLYNQKHNCIERVIVNHDFELFVVGDRRVDRIQSVGIECCL